MPCEACGIPASVEVAGLDHVARHVRLCAVCESRVVPDLVWVDAWAARGLATAAQSTRDHYTADVVRLILHLHRHGSNLGELSEVTTAEELIFGLETGWMRPDWAGKTWRRCKSTLERFFGWLSRQQGAPLARDPVASWPAPPRGQNVLRLPSAEVVEALLVAPKRRRERNTHQASWRYHIREDTVWRDTLIIGLPRFLGLRADELTRLRIMQVYVDGSGHPARDIAHAAGVAHQVTILGKGRRERTLVLPLGAHQVLGRHRTERVGYAQSDPRVVPLSNSRIRAIFRSYAREVGSPALGIHSMRHYFASEWYLARSRELLVEGQAAATADAVAIRELGLLLGHSYPRTTEAYVHGRLVVAPALLVGEGLPAELLGGETSGAGQ